MTTQSKNKPAHTVNFGNIRISVWENKNQEGKTYHNFDFKRSYKGADGEWNEQRVSLGLNELLKASHALSIAFCDYYTLPQFKGNEGGSQKENQNPDSAQPNGDY